jgi:hypothetical protein
MKKLRISGILLVLIAILAICVPVSATATSSYTVSGIEIFKGIDIGNDNYGATFVAQTLGITTLGVLKDTNGILRASINYRGIDPIPNGSNEIFGGNWTLTVTKGGNAIGTIIGRVTSGKIYWTGGAGTDTGTIRETEPLNLSVIGGTGKLFTGIKGYGTFTGHDNHISTIIVGGIMVPTVDGTLSLTLNK